MFSQLFPVRRRFQLFYAVQFVGVAIFMPYVALYLTHVGLTGPQLGLLLGSMPLAAFLVQPLWGLLTDIYQIRRTALTAGCFLTAGCAFAFGLTDQFSWLFLIALVMSVARSPIPPISTALALDHLEKEERHEDFGSLRLWGSIGFILTSFLIGGLIVGPTIRYITIFYSIDLFLLAIISLTLPDAPLKQKANWREGVTLLKREPILSVFLLGSLIIGMTIGIVNNYLAVYLTEIQATGWIIGVAMGISAMPEIPLMAGVPKMILRWGLPVVLLVGLAALPLRWFLYILIDEPLLVLPTQLLHGVGLTAILVVGVIYVDRLLTRQWRATGQALYTATQFGIGPSLGLFVAGYLYEVGGITSLWVFSTLAGLVGLGIVAWSVQMPSLSQAAERSQP